MLWDVKPSGKLPSSISQTCPAVRTSDDFPISPIEIPDPVEVKLSLTQTLIPEISLHTSIESVASTYVKELTGAIFLSGNTVS